jgi:pyruvate dehydrogenase E2 component (dihydrolipoamide acetyltransferase)
MPAPAAGVEEATLLEWSVADHATFALSDVLLVIETDKAVIDVEAETDGVLHRRLVSAGQSVAVGTPLAVIGTDSDSAADIEAMVAEANAGDGPAVASTASGADAAGHDDSHGQATVAKADADVTALGRIFASPIARQMAKAAGLTLDDLTGTGPGGRIVRWDVEQAAARHRDVVPAASSDRSDDAPHAVPAAPPVMGRSAGRISERGYVDEPHTKVRSAIAARLTFSKQAVPHFYVQASPKVDALLAMRAELNAAGGQKVSVNDLVIRAVARAHRLVPAANVIFTEEATRRFDYVDIAVAIATGGGLVTPVIRDVDRASIAEIAATTTDFATRARSGRLRQHELEGGSITVTNLGMFGTQEFSAIINPPHSAILAVGAARLEPVAVEGSDGPELAVATVMHLVLSVDHRVLDGVIAAQWMAALIHVLEHPVQILA